jgi:ferredoxin
MIIADRKPFAEIRQMVNPYHSLLLVGCGTCTTICWAGGEKEVGILASQLRLARRADDRALSVDEGTIERQCEKEMASSIRDKVSKVEAIVSMGCGAGVQTLAEIFDHIPVFPALNTAFIGTPLQEGVWAEMCVACGDCFLDRTGGICPIARCAKGILNGPCGGTKRGGKCEIDANKNCAWVLIYQRLNDQGRLDLMQKYYQPKNFRAVKRPGRIESVKA